MRSEARARGGFTLLEVLAAVAILAVAYSQLGASGIQGLQNEGEARRRIEASLVADDVLTDLESGIESGTVPPLGENEREQDGKRIKVAVEPYTLALPDEDAAEGGHRIGAAKSRLGGDAGAAPQPAAGPSLLGGDKGTQPALRRIVVQVAWDEGFGERVVTRVTYALDGEAASGTLGALSQAAAQQQQQQPAAAAPTGQQPIEQGQ